MHLVVAFLLLLLVGCLDAQLLPVDVSTCGPLATTITNISPGQTTADDGSSTSIITDDKYISDMLWKWNVNDRNDVTKPAYGLGSMIQFARPYYRAFSCMDGRQPYLVLGAPGAEMGLFILFMQTYVNNGGLLTNWTRGDYSTLLSAYFSDKTMDSGFPIVGTQRPLTIHTDIEAIRKLFKDANISLSLLPDESNLPAVFNASLLNKVQQNALFSTLTAVNPDHADYFGCAFLKRVLTTPDFPQLSKSLVDNAILGVLKFMFDQAGGLGDRVQWQILRFNHSETAVFFMDSQITDGFCRYAATAQDYTFRTTDELPMWIPRITQQSGEVIRSVMVVHDQAVDFRLDEYSRFFSWMTAQEKEPHTYFAGSFDGDVLRKKTLTTMRSLWVGAKTNAFTGCVPGGVCLQYLSQWKISFKQLYTSQYQTIASVIVILCLFSLWFLLWRIYVMMDTGENVLPDLKTVDKLFNKKLTGAFFDPESVSSAQEAATALTAPAATSEPLVPASQRV